ncbi:MAG: S8 family peptidase, partial [Bacteroidales bacterium]|nr:S8 family peptidase [Bacteroidales bacterium]
KNLDGTSQATPLVAGVIALMLQKNPNLTPEDICRILEETSVKLTPTKSNITGVGRVDARAAVDAVIYYDDAVIENELAELSIYPNPADDYIVVNCDKESEYQIVDNLGQTVKSGIIASDNQQVDITNLPNGVYLIKIDNLSQKFFITK